MIKISYTTARGQYDKEGNEICYWDKKRCSWIVHKAYLTEYENNQIDWWGNDNDFPMGTTKQRYDSMFKGNNNYPDIYLRVEFTQEEFKKGFPREDHRKYPNGYSYTRHWEHINYTFEEAKKIIDYLTCNKFAHHITVTWLKNGKARTKICKKYIVNRVDGKEEIKIETSVLQKGQY